MYLYLFCLLLSPFGVEGRLSDIVAPTDHGEDNYYTGLKETRLKCEKFALAMQSIYCQLLALVNNNNGPGNSEIESD